MDTSLFRKDFKIFSSPLNKDLIYFDNAATSQRPECVNEAVSEFYDNHNANPLRGLYGLSVRATERYEEARETVAGFLNASESSEIIFTRKGTESLNVAACSYGMSLVEEGDGIVISSMQHHSNILP